MIVSSRQTKPIAEEYLREQVVSIEHIAQLARAGRACCRRCMGIMPAAVLLNMPAALLLRWTCATPCKCWLACLTIVCKQCSRKIYPTFP